MKKEDLDLAIVTAARAVKEFGDRYLPIFEMLQKERELLNQRLEAKNLAIEIALSYTKSDETDTH